MWKYEVSSAINPISVPTASRSCQSSGEHLRIHYYCLIFFLFFLGKTLESLPFEKGFCYVAQAGSEFTILLSNTSLELELKSEVTGLKLKFAFVCLFAFFLSKTESPVAEDDFDLIRLLPSPPKG